MATSGNQMRAVSIVPSSNNQRVLDNTHSAWKSRHNHRGIRRLRDGQTPKVHLACVNDIESPVAA